MLEDTMRRVEVVNQHNQVDQRRHSCKIKEQPEARPKTTKSKMKKTSFVVICVICCSCLQMTSIISFFFSTFNQITTNLVDRMEIR